MRDVKVRSVLVEGNAGLVNPLDPAPLPAMSVVEDLPLADPELRGGSLSAAVFPSPPHRRHTRTDSY